MSLLLRHHLVHRTPGPPPTTARAGAPLIFHSGDEVSAYAQRIDIAIEALYQDMRRKIVYATPGALRATGDHLPETPFKANAKAALYAEAATMQAREAGRSPEQIAKEVAFGRDYVPFYSNWKQWLHDHQSGWTLYASMWDSIEVYDSQYHVFYNRFKNDLKVTPSGPPALTNPEIDKEHPGTLTTATKNALGSIPWTTIAVVVVGGVIAYTLLSKGKGDGGGGGREVTVIGGGGDTSHMLPEHAGATVHDAEFEPA